MKKISVLFAFLLVAAVTFVGCKKDEETPDVPTITVSLKSGYDNVAWMGDTVKYTVTMGSNEELATLKIEPNVGNTGSNVITETLSGTSKTYEYTYVVPTASIDDGDVISITFTVTDNKDGKNTATQSITMDEPTSETPFTYTENGQFYHIAGLLQGAYDLDADGGVSVGGTASTKSMKNTDAAGSAFTGTWTSDAANATTYVKANTYTYTSATVESAATAFALGSASATVTNPAANDIYIGKKGASTYYVIKISNVEPSFSTGTGTNTGKISFEYKKM